MIPQGILAACLPFILGGTSKVATQWFGDNERAVATAIGGLALPFGHILGFSCAPFFVNDRDDLTLLKSEIINYMFFQSCAVTFMCSFVILFYHNPKFYATRAAEI